MKVKDLIELLKSHDPEMLVAYPIYSEQALLESRLIKVEKHCAPRPDGWVHSFRPGEGQVSYLMISTY